MPCCHKARNVIGTARAQGRSRRLLECSRVASFILDISLPAGLSKDLGFRLLEMSPQTKQGIELKIEQSLPRPGLNNVAG